MSNNLLRKRLLIAESELNRAHLTAEVVILIAEVRAFSNRTSTLSAVAVSGAAVVGDLLKAPAKDGSGMSWLRSAIDGVELVSSLWATFRPRKH